MVASRVTSISKAAVRILKVKIAILVIEAKHFTVLIKDFPTEVVLQNNKCCCNFKCSEIQRGYSLKN